LSSTELAAGRKPATSIEVGDGELVGRVRAMATEVCIRAVGNPGDVSLADAVTDALDIFVDVESSCTRFDPNSPLMRANREPDQWHRVPPRCFDALAEAYRAYEETGGRFDPRVLSDLLALGYDRTLPFGSAPVAVDAAAPRRRLARPPWHPRFRRSTGDVSLGGIPVDLGGIGKGLAVRWASERLRTQVPDHLVEAGGDCYCAGHAPEGGPWHIGVEDPGGQPQAVLVLALSDEACTTSSIRVRRWTSHGTPVHHLIDPTSGLPGGHGLASVTVVAPDPATAEVWSKTLFLAGRGGIEAETTRRSLAACWTTLDGTTDMSLAMRRRVLWRRP